MADNVFKFRRLKWADPEHKLQMLPCAPKRRKLPWVDLGLTAFIGAALVVIACSLPWI